MWDTDRRIRRAKVISESIKENINLHSEMNVLEFGCGTGLISFNLYQSVNEIIGYDTSEKMLDVFNRKIIELNVMNVKSTTNLLKYSNQIDCVISSMVFHHIPDIKSQLYELSNVLTSNGELFIVDLDKEDGRFHQDEIGFDGHNGFERNELCEIIRSVCFEIIDVGTVLRDMKSINGNEVPYSLFYIHARKINDD
jgi:ubiquinone/menaquinone biosynthesis C-methylase UbiE